MPGSIALSQPGILHHIPESLSAFEIGHRTDAPNTVLFIGGLFDTYGTVTYPFTLAPRLPPSWRLAQVSLNSSGRQWGVASLDTDIADLAQIVAYFRSLRHDGKVVLLGHSTGCQDALYYASASGERPPVDGISLQAAVSDAEAFGAMVPAAKLDAANKLAKKLIDEGMEGCCIPSEHVPPEFGTIGITAQRWLSLISPEGKGQDDLFSQGLTDERLERSFGALPEGLKVQFLSSGSDEYVPKTTDVKALLERWTAFAQKAGAVVHPGSGEQVPGASHNLNKNPPEVVEELVKRIVSFVESV